MIRRVVAASACAALAVFSTSAFAQGKGQPKKKASAPPSRNELAAPAVVAPGRIGATPLAWIDDASLLEPGAVSFSISALRWSGSGSSEVDAPIVDAAFGLARRVQLSASVPRVVGAADPSGAAGGVGTSFFSAKIAVHERPAAALRVAVAPTLQVLGEGVVAALGPDESRVRWGVPVSAEIARGTTRLYGGGGYFAPGLWFTGVAVSTQATDKIFLSGGISRAWRTTEVPGTPLGDRDRKEISGGVAYVLTPAITAFGSLGHTVATLDENGAGTSIGGGLTFSFATAGR